MCLTLGAQPAAAFAQAAPDSALVLRATNTLAFARPGETISLPWATLRAQLPGAEPRRLRVIDAASGAEIVSQVVDDDGDGTPDELIFQGSFFPGEARSYRIERAAPRVTTSPAAAYSAHIPERDDLAWENDRIGFRTYGVGLAKLEPLISSGIDVWVKRVRYPIIDKWYSRGHTSYHVDTGEGADFFDVGPTLGAGGTAIWRNGTLYRSHNFSAWRIIANGPLRTVFELKYEPWDAAGLRVSEVKRISLTVGDNLSRAESFFEVVGTSGAKSTIPAATGLVKRAGMVGSESSARQWAWLAGWGPVDRKNGGHGELGTAVLLPRARVDDWKETGDHYLAITHAAPGEPMVVYMGAGWTGSGDFRDVRDWWNYLDQFAERLETPLEVTLARSAAATGAER